MGVGWVGKSYFKSPVGLLVGRREKMLQQKQRLKETGISANWDRTDANSVNEFWCFADLWAVKKLSVKLSKYALGLENFLK